MVSRYYRWYDESFWPKSPACRKQMSVGDHFGTHGVWGRKRRKEIGDYSGTCHLGGPYDMYAGNSYAGGNLTIWRILGNTNTTQAFVLRSSLGLRLGIGIVPSKKLRSD
jgi:hypothetical protein